MPRLQVGKSYSQFQRGHDAPPNPHWNHAIEWLSPKAHKLRAGYDPLFQTILHNAIPHLEPCSHVAFVH